MVKQYVERFWRALGSRDQDAPAGDYTDPRASEPQFAALSDDDLRAQTALHEGSLAFLENGASLDSILAPAFAVVREAGKRVLVATTTSSSQAGWCFTKVRSQRCVPVKGKTLVATLPVYLSEIAHLVTVNDYLAAGVRSSGVMGKLYGWLGLSTGIITADISTGRAGRLSPTSPTARTTSLASTTCRDNMKFAHDEMVWRRLLARGIVDAVDAICDRRRGVRPDHLGTRRAERRDLPQSRSCSRALRRDVEYVVEERSPPVFEAGVGAGDGRLGVNNLYDMQHIEMVHHMNEALRAHAVPARRRLCGHGR